MKPIIIFGVALIIATIASAKEAIRLGDEIYYLSYTENSKDGSLKEFLPPGETLETWTRMLAIRTYSKIRSPKAQIAAMAQTYHAQYPHMQFAVFEKKETNEWIIDFIIYPREQDSGQVEWNYFQAGKVTGVKGIVVNQYVARKPFSGSLEKVFKEWNLGDYRTKMLGILMPEKFVIVDLPDPKN